MVGNTTYATPKRTPGPRTCFRCHVVHLRRTGRPLDLRDEKKPQQHDFRTGRKRAFPVSRMSRSLCKSKISSGRKLVRVDQNPSIHPSIHPSINQSINQSINAMCRKRLSYCTYIFDTQSFGIEYM
jgi:hypothetical protein